MTTIDGSKIYGSWYHAVIRKYIKADMDDVECVFTEAYIRAHYKRPLDHMSGAELRDAIRTADADKDKYPETTLIEWARRWGLIEQKTEVQ